MENITLLIPDTFYHIYNKSVGNEKGFIEERNYPFFLEKLKNYITPIAFVYAYCLLPNHYHLLVKIKSNIELENYKKKQAAEKKLIGNFENIEEFVVKQFSNMNNSYTKAFNNTYNRKGKLFLQSFKRKEIDNNDYFTKIIHYIHSNPVHLKYVSEIKNWNHSSYNSILSVGNTLLEREKVLECFGGQEKFLQFHKETAIVLH